MKSLNLLILLFCLLFNSCKHATVIDNNVFDTRDLIRANSKLLDIAMVDGFSPPVASRVYLYPHLANYFTLHLFRSDSLSGLDQKLNGLNPFDHEVVYGLNPEFVALLAFCKMGKKVIFSEHLMEDFKNDIIDKAREHHFSKRQIDESDRFADLVVHHLSQWINEDNYVHTRTLDRHTSVKEPGKWVETPPDYMAGLEPHWQLIRTLVIDSLDKYVINYPPEFNKKPTSDFYKMVMEVYDQSMQLDSTMIQTALYWDDNPNITEHRGHLVTMVHKISPPGHWLNIISQISEKEGFSYIKTTELYTYVTITMFDAIVSCWHTKYKTNLIRPVTFIQENIDSKWKPLIQTPPFPEFTSGHSVISASAATILEHFLGQDFAFTDSTEVIFGFTPRSYTSFDQAAWEVSMSRFYAGIHYKNGIEEGYLQGKRIAKDVLEKLSPKELQ